MSENRLSRLDALRFLRRVVEQQFREQLARIDRWIAEEQRREAERRRGAEARRPVPEWTVEVGIGRGRWPVTVHVGGCHMAGGRQRPVSREQAVRARNEGVQGCTHCSVDAVLGYLEG